MTEKDNDQTSDEVTVETTSVFRADFLNELDAPAQPGGESAVSGVEGLPVGSALLVVKRGPNAGSRFLLDQPTTSAGRHPDSDIFLDDVTVSRRHAELQRRQYKNDEIWPLIMAELGQRRFPAPALSERQLRRIVYS